jgi:transposase-like protein
MGHFRQLVSSTLDDEDTLIGGPGVIVEIDESKISKRKYNRGHRVEGAWVVGGVEHTPQRKVFLVSVQNRSRNTLENIIRRHVAAGSIIRTDLWRGYGFLDEDLTYEHQSVNHSLYLRDPNTGVHTNTIEGTWSGLKRNIQMRYRTNSAIDKHLVEFIWRRKHAGDLWGGFLDALRDVHYDLE